MTSTGTAENNWIKLYESVLDDPDLQEMPAEHFRLLVNCWLLAHRYGNKLGTIRQISFRLHMDQAFVAEAMESLKDYFKCSDGTYVVAKWDVWQTTQKSTDRARKSRERKKQENTPSSCNSLTDATFATPATIATIDAAAATFATNAVAPATIATTEKKRKEENRKEESVAAVAATRAVPPPPAEKQQQQPDFFPFDDEPDVQRLVSEAVEEVATHWPMLGNVPNAKRVWERHAVSDPQGPEAWCRKIRQTALVHQAAHERCKRSNARHFIPTLEKWVQDGDYARKPPTAMEGGHMRLIDMFPEVPNAS